MKIKIGAPRVCEEVWITSIGSSKCEKHGRLTVGYGAEPGGPKIGPEFTFGITMENIKAVMNSMERYMGCYS